MSYVVNREVYEPTSQKKLVEPITTVPEGYWVLPGIQMGLQFTRVRDVGGRLLNGERSTNDIRIIAPDLKEYPFTHYKEWKDEKRISDTSGEKFTRRESVCFSRARPFGVIRSRTVNGVRVGGLELVCARQVHKGELGRYPKIPKPAFLTPSFRISSSLPKDTYDRTCWARLDQVARLVSMKTEDLIVRYFDFSCKEIRHLEVIVATAERLARGMCLAPRTYHEDMLGYLVCLNPATVWLRRSFVLNVLHLRALGYVPPLQS